MLRKGYAVYSISKMLISARFSSNSVKVKYTLFFMEGLRASVFPVLRVPDHFVNMQLEGVMRLGCGLSHGTIRNGLILKVTEVGAFLHKSSLVSLLKLQASLKGTVKSLCTTSRDVRDRGVISQSHFSLFWKIPSEMSFILFMRFGK